MCVCVCLASLCLKRDLVCVLVFSALFDQSDMSNDLSLLEPAFLVLYL